MIVNEMLGEDSQDFEALLDSTTNYDFSPPKRGEIRTAIISHIDPREIIVDLNAKHDGIVQAQDLERLDEQFRNSLKVGDEVPVYILTQRNQDENLIVSINMGLQRYDWVKARELLKSEDAVSVLITGHNRGGVLVRWNRLEGFIPGSHLVSVSYGADRTDAWREMKDRTIGVKVIEVDQDRRRLIFSEREAQREWRAQQKRRLLEELQESDVVKGTVTGLRDFGAFVNLGGADGLIHVSELAWHRVDHPRDLLAIGQEIDVYVLELNYESNRIALSRKRLLSDPWDIASSKYHEGQLVEGVVTNVVDFGAFAALDDGLEGLLHLSEMGDGSLKEPHSYVKKGDRLSMRISHLEPEKRRVGFTQRWGTDLDAQSSDNSDPSGSDVALDGGEGTSEGEVDAQSSNNNDSTDSSDPSGSDIALDGGEGTSEGEVDAQSQE